MKVTIHRGTHEIGGSCVEIEEGFTRIVIDIGLPLQNTGIPEKVLQNLIENLQPQEVVPVHTNEPQKIRHNH